MFRNSNYHRNLSTYSQFMLKLYYSVDKLLKLLEKLFTSTSIKKPLYEIRHFHNFKCGLGQEQGPPSLLRTIG